MQGFATPFRSVSKVALPLLSAAVVLLALPVTARADDTIKHPGDHPAYNVEVEPHLVLGWDDQYAAGGYGLGMRFSIPLMDNGFVTTINNSVAISFGFDLIHDDGCWYNGDCSANYFYFPVAMQWNFYVAQRFSVFGEPGLVIDHGFVSDCPANSQCPNGRPNGTRGIGIEPAIFIGGRYYLTDQISLTARIGFPSFTFGVSFFP